VKLAIAKKRAELILKQVRKVPGVKRAEIAGSIRRNKAEVKDIEIAVCLEPGDVNFYLWAIQKVRDWKWIKPGTNNPKDLFAPTGEIISWPVKMGANYLRGLLPDKTTKIDFFITGPETWGNIFLMRTGPWEFSMAVFTYAKNRGTPHVQGRFVDKAGNAVVCEEVFKFLGLEFVPPNERVNFDQIRPERI
jgi:DNA polymerase/3'-5' exonuclease PolX